MTGETNTPPTLDTGLQAVKMPPEHLKSGGRSHLTRVGRWIEAKSLIPDFP